MRVLVAGTSRAVGHEVLFGSAMTQFEKPDGGPPRLAVARTAVPSPTFGKPSSANAATPFAFVVTVRVPRAVGEAELHCGLE